MKPVFVDTFRPAQEQQIGLVRRLAKAVLPVSSSAGTASDMAVIVRDARRRTNCR